MKYGRRQRRSVPHLRRQLLIGGKLRTRLRIPDKRFATLECLTLNSLRARAVVREYSFAGRKASVKIYIFKKKKAEWWNEMKLCVAVAFRGAMRAFIMLIFFHACAARIFIVVLVYFPTAKYGFRNVYFSKITKWIKAPCAFDEAKKRIELFLTRRMIKPALHYMYRMLKLGVQHKTILYESSEMYVWVSHKII